MLDKKQETSMLRSAQLLGGLTLSVAAGALIMLGRYVQHEIIRRGYPSWNDCHCDFKQSPIIFQALYSRYEQQGETIISHEWGTHLVNPPQWLRRFLHHSSQVAATLNPSGHYVERVTLNPQEARQFAGMLRSNAATTEEVQEENAGQDQVIWRRELLNYPRTIFDLRMRRLYPVHVPPERSAQAQSLPALWNPHNNLPLTTEGSLLDTAVGTRIDCIGWNTGQISYCTARVVAQ